VHGSLKDPESGSPREGKIIDLQFMARFMEESEVQDLYYKTSHVVEGLEGPAEIVNRGHHTAQIEIDAYPDQILSVIPPVLFQSRCPMVDCKTQVPGLSLPVGVYLSNQTAHKCYDAYTCEFPATALLGNKSTNFACVDRKKQISTKADGVLWFGRPTVTLNMGDEMHGFPEFLDVMTLGQVYRDGEMRDARSWIDIQSTAIVAINIFLDPASRSGTLLSMNWQYEGPGKLAFDYTFYSYSQMRLDTQDKWRALSFACIIMAIADLILLLIDVIRRVRLRRTWRLHVYHKGNTDEQPEDLQTVRTNIPLLEFLDFFDLGLRVALLIFLIQHIAHYYSPNLQSTNTGKFEEQIASILAIPWGDLNIDYATKVERFFTIVVDFMDLLAIDKSNRAFAYWIIILSFFRIVVYCRVHPKMAVLYKTVEVAVSDLFHFMIVFALLFCTLAFLGTWHFGGVLEKFGSFPMTCDTQFKMIIGEFPFDDKDFSPDVVLYFVYLLVFAFVVFFLLLNFFLAIVVDSYAAIQEKVKETVVEHAFLADIGASLLYPPFAILNGLPQRRTLFDRLLLMDIDADLRNDEETEERGADVIVHPESLVRCKIVQNLQHAYQLLAFYMIVCPSLHVDYEETSVALEHQKSLNRELDLDKLRFKLDNPEPPKKIEGKADDEATEKIVLRLDQLITSRLHAWSAGNRDDASQLKPPVDSSITQTEVMRILQQAQASGHLLEEESARIQQIHEEVGARFSKG